MKDYHINIVCNETDRGYIAYLPSLDDCSVSV